MRYLGGKHRQGKTIAKHINEAAQGRMVFEPFCGGLGVTQHLAGPVFASDGCEALITLYNAMLDGWVPPDTLTREEYAVLKATKDPDDPMTAFAGFGCSFGANWFCSYAQPTKAQDYPANARNSLVRKFKALPPTTFVHMLFDDVLGLIDVPCVVYCDPPYQDTRGYTAVPGQFDSGAFWDQCEGLVSRGHIVFVSEFMNPRGHDVVWSVTRKSTLTRMAKKATERTELLIRVR